MVQCYYKNDDQVIRQMNTGVCAGSGSADGHSSCCWPWDECIGESLCYDKTNTIYYTALCTDQTLEDPVCQHGCNGIYLDRLAYNSSSNSWACCSRNTACSTSFNDTLLAPAPEILRQNTMTIVDFIPTTTPTSSPRSSTSAATTSLTSSLSPASITAPANTEGSSGDSSLSGGAKAGIGIGASIGALLIIATAVFVLIRKRRITTTTTTTTKKVSTDDNTAMGNGHGVPEKDGRPTQHHPSSRLSPYPMELPGQERVSELDPGGGGSRRPQELSA